MSDINVAYGWESVDTLRKGDCGWEMGQGADLCQTTETP